MTRLDSAIRRLTAQRDLLDWAAGEIAPTGFVLELGLGNGRTYDHLRDRLPGREIYVFERSPAAHPSCTPPEAYLFVGDIFDTLPAFIERFGAGMRGPDPRGYRHRRRGPQSHARPAGLALAGSAPAARRPAGGRPRLRASPLRRHLGRDRGVGGAVFRLSQRRRAGAGCPQRLTDRTFNHPPEHKPAGGDRRDRGRRKSARIPGWSVRGSSARRAPSNRRTSHPPRCRRRG